MCRRPRRHFASVFASAAGWDNSNPKGSLCRRTAEADKHATRGPRESGTKTPLPLGEDARRAGEGDAARRLAAIPGRRYRKR